MTKTPTGYDVLVYVKVSKQRHLKRCHICIQNVITERMRLNDSCHKHALNLHYIISMCHVMIIEGVVEE